jgi:hypothetical protein
MHSCMHYISCCVLVFSHLALYERLTLFPETLSKTAYLGDELQSDEQGTINSQGTALGP